MNCPAGAAAQEHKVSGRLCVYKQLWGIDDKTQKATASFLCLLLPNNLCSPGPHDSFVDMSRQSIDLGCCAGGFRAFRLFQKKEEAWAPHSSAYSKCRICTAVM